MKRLCKNTSQSYMCEIPVDIIVVNDEKLLQTKPNDLF